jgi:hypothetical protein
MGAEQRYIKVPVDGKGKIKMSWGVYAFTIVAPLIIISLVAFLTVALAWSVK